MPSRCMQQVKGPVQGGVLLARAPPADRTSARSSHRRPGCNCGSPSFFAHSRTPICLFVAVAGRDFGDQLVKPVLALRGSDHDRTVSGDRQREFLSLSKPGRFYHSQWDPHCETVTPPCKLRLGRRVHMYLRRIYTTVCRLSSHAPPTHPGSSRIALGRDFFTQQVCPSVGVKLAIAQVVSVLEEHSQERQPVGGADIAFDVGDLWAPVNPWTIGCHAERGRRHRKRCMRQPTLYGQSCAAW